MSQNQMHKHRVLYEKTAVHRNSEKRGIIDLVEIYDNQTANFKKLLPPVEHIPCPLQRQIR